MNYLLPEDLKNNITMLLQKANHPNTSWETITYIMRQLDTLKKVDNPVNVADKVEKKNA